jgi:hypothetical protein
VVPRPTVLDFYHGPEAADEDAEVCVIVVRIVAAAEVWACGELGQSMRTMSRFGK